MQEIIIVGVFTTGGHVICIVIYLSNVILLCPKIRASQQTRHVETMLF